MSAALSDEQIVDAIKERVRENPGHAYGSDGEFASSLQLGIPITRVKGVMSRLIRARSLIRSRPQPEHPGAYDRPITFQLVGSLTR